MCDAVTKSIVALTSAAGGYALKSLMPEAPDTPDVTLEPEPAADITDPAAQKQSQRERRRRASAAGRRSTILSSPQGAAVAPQTAPVKTLLGA